jgi:hypothetical protein
MSKTTTIQLIVSDEKKPKVALKPGMKLEVVAVQLVDPELKPAAAIGKATLCSGGGTCVAIVEV